MKVPFNLRPTVNQRLCSNHFADHCFEYRPGYTKKVLLNGSVPTIFPGPVTRWCCVYCKVQNGKSVYRYN